MKDQQSMSLSVLCPILEADPMKVIMSLMPRKMVFGICLTIEKLLLALIHQRISASFTSMFARTTKDGKKNKIQV